MLVRAQHEESQEALEDSCYFSVTSDKSVVLQELTLGLLTGFVEKKPSLSLLSLGSSSQSEKSCSDRQIVPELLNETISAKAT